MGDIAQAINQAAPKPTQKIPQTIKAQIAGMTTVILANGDVICLQPRATEVFRLVGQKDGQPSVRGDNHDGGRATRGRVTCR